MVIASMTGQAQQTVRPWEGEPPGGENTEGLPRLTAGLTLHDAAMDRIKVGNGRLTVRSDGKQLVANAVFDRDPGELVAELRSELAWTGIIPGFSPTSLGVWATTTVISFA